MRHRTNIDVIFGCFLGFVEGEIPVLLKDGSIGQSYVVQSFDLPTSMQRHLEALGMTHHTPITVLNRKSPGIMIIQLRGSRYALGYSVTKKIEVIPLAEDLISVLNQTQLLVPRD